MTTAQISITVPANDERALVSAATMLLTQAGKLAMPDLDDVSTQTHTSGASEPNLTDPPERIGQRHAETDQAAPEAPTADGQDITPGAGEDNTAPNAGEDSTGELPDTPAPTAPVPGAETDAAGMPWDSRIHASTKTKTKDGHWKKRKGVDDATRQAVEAELKNLMAIPSPAPTENETGGVDSDAPPAPAATAPPAPEAPAAAAPPPAPEAPAQDNGDQDMDFATFLREVSQRIQNGHITMERVNEIVVGEGIQSISMLSNRPDLIPGIWQQIQMLIGENQ